MKLRQTRRRFLCISAASMAMAGAGMRETHAQSARWRGTALGAAATMQLTDIAPAAAQSVFHDMERELGRLEAIFSLYRPDSEIARLNRNGRLDAPSPELLEVLSLSDRINLATDGAFDPTVQPLFTASARAAGEGRAPTKDEIRSAHELVGWDGVRFDPTCVRLERPGAALTLNGIAQGYITDRIAERLRDRGLTDVLIDLGEVRASGRGPGGRAWRVGIADPAGEIQRRIVLSERAVATSSPHGTLLDQAGKLAHIFDPSTGGPAARANLISVSNPRADVADGLSTAFCALNQSRRTAVLGAFPGTRLELQT